jgi:hypothetical protein
MNRNSLELIWNALSFYREHGIPEGSQEYDNEWDEICTTMAWIQEDLGLKEETD